MPLSLDLQSKSIPTKPPSSSPRAKGGTSQFDPFSAPLGTLRIRNIRSISYQKLSLTPLHSITHSLTHSQFSQTLLRSHHSSPNHITHISLIHPHTDTHSLSHTSHHITSLSVCDCLGEWQARNSSHCKHRRHTNGCSNQHHTGVSGSGCSGDHVLLRSGSR